jgi:ankyrin repeat protein
MRRLFELQAHQATERLWRAIRPPVALRQVAELLDAGANINAISHANFTLLQTAAYHGQTQLVDLLIARGADANLVPGRPDGCTPLELAIRKNHTAIIEQLLSDDKTTDLTQRITTPRYGLATPTTRYQLLCHITQSQHVINLLTHCYQRQCLLSVSSDTNSAATSAGLFHDRPRPPCAAQAYGEAECKQENGKAVTL